MNVLLYCFLFFFFRVYVTFYRANLVSRDILGKKLHFCVTHEHIHRYNTFPSLQELFPHNVLPFPPLLIWVRLYFPFLRSVRRTHFPIMRWKYTPLPSRSKITRTSLKNKRDNISVRKVFPFLALKGWKEKLPVGYVFDGTNYDSCPLGLCVREESYRIFFFRPPNEVHTAS